MVGNFEKVIFRRKFFLLIIFFISNCAWTTYGVFRLEKIKENGFNQEILAPEFCLELENGQKILFSGSLWSGNLSVIIKFHSINDYVIPENEILLFNISDTIKLLPRTKNNLKNFQVPKDSNFSMIYEYNLKSTPEENKEWLTNHQLYLKLPEFLIKNKDKILKLPKIKADFNYLLPKKWRKYEK